MEAQGIWKAPRELPQVANSVALPLRVVSPQDDKSNEQMQYWPFNTSDLYTWKNQNPSFSDNLRAPINLLDSVIFTHQPTWENYNQLLQVLFTVEERERILTKAQKLFPGPDGNPTVNPALIEQIFPLTHPN